MKCLRIFRGVIIWLIHCIFIFFLEYFIGLEFWPINLSLEQFNLCFNFTSNSPIQGVTNHLTFFDFLNFNCFQYIYLFPNFIELLFYLFNYVIKTLVSNFILLANFLYFLFQLNDHYFLFYNFFLGLERRFIIHLYLWCFKLFDGWIFVDLVTRAFLLLIYFLCWIYYLTCPFLIDYVIFVFGRLYNMMKCLSTLIFNVCYLFIVIHIIAKIFQILVDFFIHSILDFLYLYLLTLCHCLILRLISWRFLRSGSSSWKILLCFCFMIINLIIFLYIDYLIKLILKIWCSIRK